MPGTRRAENEQPPKPEQEMSKEILELQHKIDALDSAMSSILLDATTTPLTKKEKKSIIKWAKIGRWSTAKEGGHIKDWPLDDAITQENYRDRLADYGIADFIDPTLIEPNESLYSIVEKQYKKYIDQLKETEKLSTPPATNLPEADKQADQPRKPSEVRPLSEELTETPEPPIEIGDEDIEESTPEPAPLPLAPETPEPPETPPAETPPETPEPPEAETKPVWQIEDPEQVEKIRKSWKVWEMLFALLHAMQRYPEKYAKLAGLTEEERNKKLKKECPQLVKEYIQLATRGGMQWDRAKEMWAPQPTKETNMDVKVSLFILRRAGFKVDTSDSNTANVEMTVPGAEGTANPFVLQFDTMDSAKKERLDKERKLAHMHIESHEDGALQEGEYRVTVDHHTKDPSERQTCAAQLIYDYFLAAGLIKKDETLERLLKFTTEHDNGRSPEGMEFYRRSAKTLWGIASDTRVPTEILYKIMERGREPEDELTDEDLQEALPNPTARGPRTIEEFVRNKENDINRNIKSFEWWSQRGYVIETDYGPMWVVPAVEGRYMPRQLINKAFGVPNTLIWQPEEHSFFVSLGGEQSFTPDVIFPQGEIIRGHMAIYKRQERTPEKLTTSLSDLILILTKSNPSFSPEKDLRAFLLQEPNRFATVQTIFYIYHNNPDKQQACLDALEKRKNIVSQLEKARDSMSNPETKRKYQEIIDKVKDRLGIPKRRKRK